ncbi:MAG: MptD family putative ECF transporter S component, partial [Saccharofermentanales bacterium]
MFQKFQVKELVFLAILSAVLLLTTAITVAAVMYTNIFALRQLLAAVPFAFFSAIALRKVPKAGALSLIGILTGIVLLFILPVLFFNQVIGAVLAELIALLFFRSYSTKKAAYLAAALYVPLTLPVTVGFNYIVEG